MRIVLAEDSVLLREGLVRLIAEAGHEVVAAVGDADAFLAAVHEADPDLAVVDVRMPPTHTDEGLRAAVAARTAHPGLKVLVLSQYVEEAYARDLLADRRGGVGYLLKDRISDLRALTDALDTLAAGGTVVDPEVVAQLLIRPRLRDPLNALTPREKEVLLLMAQGRTNVAIADTLVVSVGAVEKHVSSIFTKLDLAPSDTDHRRVLAVLACLGLRVGRR